MSFIKRLIEDDSSLSVGETNHRIKIVVFMYVALFLNCLTHTESRIQYFIEIPVLITKNLMRAGTNAGRLTEHLDTKFYRNRIRSVY